VNKTANSLFKLILVFAAALLLMAGFFSALAANPVRSEVEPNDTPATADTLDEDQDISGTIHPTGDVDYFQVNGVNQLWGYIAMLDTSASITSTQGTLTAFGQDGTTQLQIDSGSWISGSILAWQKFVDGSADPYIRVSETGDDETLGPYLLRYYRLAMSVQDEGEPNDTPATAMVSAKSNMGALGSPGDVDCFSISVKAGEQFLFALNADPDNDGSNTDFELKLYDPVDALVTSADVGGVGNNEVIDNIIMPETGIYKYCVSAASGTPDPLDEYIAGPVRNGHNYYPTYTLKPVWLNPGPAGAVAMGSSLSFQLNFTNTSLLPLPGWIGMYGRFDENCLELVDAPGAYYTSTKEARWEMVDLGPGEVFTAEFETRAKIGCQGKVHESVVMEYYDLGVGKDGFYNVLPGVYLPLVTK
jgi:hypothetical protein